MGRIAIDFDGAIVNTNVLIQKWLRSRLDIHIEPWQCCRSHIESLGIRGESYDRMIAELYQLDKTLDSPPCQGVISAVRQLLNVGELCLLLTNNEAGRNVPPGPLFILRNFQDYVVLVIHQGH